MQIIRTNAGSTGALQRRRRWGIITSLALFGALGGCDDGGSASPPAPDMAPVDATPPVDRGMDRGAPDARLVDAAPDAAPQDQGVVDMADAMWLPRDPALEAPPPGAWRVGTAIRRMPVPLGIGTSGFGPTQAEAYSTPFQQAYPGTRRIHLHPDLRVAVFEAGDGNRLYLVRIDAIGVTANIRRALVERLSRRYGPKVDQQLVIAATHTHSGPGRLIDKPLWRVIADRFFPEFFDRMVDDLEGALVEAVEGMQPARVGLTVASTTALHNDRRCANPEEDDPDLPILEIADLEGNTRGLLLFHTIHGTALGMRQYSLSQDVTGAIEAKVAERFADDVFVMFVNGAAADMSPGNPPLERDDAAAPWPGDYEQCEAVGQAAADTVMGALDGVELKAEGIVHSRTARVPLNREAIGYGEGEFPYQYGAVYCGAGLDEHCVGEPPYENLLIGCIAMPDAENAAPTQAPITVGQIGDLSFVTTPGEFSVALGRRAAQAFAAETGQTTVVIGYAQEYTGYSLGEDDWHQGGYEASGALWGPRQGDHLADAVISLARSYVDSRLPLRFVDQPPLPVPPDYVYDPWPTMRSPVPAAVVSEPPESVGKGEVVEFVYTGGDPWLGNPVVTLEQQGEGGFAPVRLGARPVTTDGYVMTLELVPDPPYARMEAPGLPHTFNWHATLPVGRRFGGGPALAGGTFRFVARGRIHVEGAAEPVEYTLESRPFSVRP